MVKFIIKFLILTTLLAAFVLFYNNGQYIAIHSDNGIQTVAVFLGILALLNIFVKPILKLLTLPLNCLTFGLFSFVINFVVVYFADILRKDFDFTSLKYTFLFSVLFALASSILDFFLKEEE